MMNKNLHFFSWKWALLFVLILPACRRDGKKNEHTVTAPKENRVPEGFDIHGIDVSRHNGEISWEGVSKAVLDSNKIKFVFIKSTEGLQLKDNAFERNWHWAGKQKLYRGAYHYFRPKVHPAIQAKHYIQHNKLEKGDLPPVLDIESNGGNSDKAVAKACKKWLKIIEAHYGVKPIIYTNLQYYNKIVRGKIKGYPIWIAQYGDCWPELDQNDKWVFWQHNDKGRIGGIKSDVDLNVFNGDSIALRNICLQ